MKRQISSLVIASTILAGSTFTPIALNEVSAKAVQQQQKVEKETINVDGKAKSISFTKWNKHKLYSIEQLSKLMAATYKYNSKTKTYVVSKRVDKKVQKLEYKVNSGTAVINGKKTKVGLAPRLVGKALFVDANSFVSTLGGDILPLQKGSFLSTEGLVNGDTFNPQWVNNSTILATNENGEDSRTLLVNIHSKKEVSSINASELVVSPNGKQAIYSDENGFAYLVDVMSKKSIKLNSEDDSVKSEFVWSKDGQQVYFLQGDKSEKIGAINVGDGSVKTIFEDKLNYKSDLHLSANGKKLLYIAGKEGSTTFTEGDNPEVVNIDTTGTEPQIYVVNLNEATPAAVAVTATTDNKLFPGFLSNGDIVYLSAEVDNDNLPELKVIKEDKTVKTVVSNKDILSSVVTADGDVFILVAEKGSSVIYKVDTATKKLSKVAQTKLKLHSFSVSNDGKSIAATTSGVNGDAVLVLKNGVFEVITK